jgi:hypothetical protein
MLKKMNISVSYLCCKAVHTFVARHILFKLCKLSMLKIDMYGLLNGSFRTAFDTLCIVLWPRM